MLGYWQGAPLSPIPLRDCLHHHLSHLLRSWRYLKMYLTKTAKTKLIFKLLLIASVVAVSGSLYSSSFATVMLSHDIGQWYAPCNIDNCKNQPEVTCLAAKSRPTAFMMSRNGSHVIVCFLNGTNTLVDFRTFKGRWYYDEGRFLKVMSGLILVPT